ncbi:hypothetical protein [Streptococcus ruminantium]|nr:hypothetical protein [Streptococcus ruminantium]
MIESYVAFLERIRSFETATLQLPAQDFRPNAQLLTKIDDGN